MRITITTILFSFIAVAQGQDAKYNNKIGEVKTLNVYGDSNKIIIGKLIINQNVNKNLYLKNIRQEKDSSGIYITTIALDTPEDPEVVGVNLQLEFDNPAISVHDNNCMFFSAIISGLDSTGRTWGVRSTKLQIAKVFGSCEIIIKSKLPIKTTITGLAGKLENLKN